MMNVQVKLGIDIRKIHDFLINEEFITLEVNIFLFPNAIIAIFLSIKEATTIDIIIIITIINTTIIIIIVIIAD